MAVLTQMVRWSVYLNSRSFLLPLVCYLQMDSNKTTDSQTGSDCITAVLVSGDFFPCLGLTTPLALFQNTWLKFILTVSSVTKQTAATAADESPMRHCVCGNNSAGSHI
ncbi:hypothetical protein AMECASPLE_000306 [Ameca splendens]|uniref:Secreted protein n=1 Tax=Ameca splendens TaxID=208324 RepID=A0ABV0YL14_9TELE